MSRRKLLAQALLCACLAAAPAGAATYTVNIPGDPGAAPPPGFYTLRTAISAANTNPGADTIAFALGAQGSPQTISVASALPTLTDTVVIDGWSQGGPGYTGPPLITINGSSAPGSFGLNVQAQGVVVRGLRIVSFPAPSGNGFGIGLFANSSGSWIYGCEIGGNGQGGIWVGTTSGQVLIGTNSDGTDDAAERNVIHDNGLYGVLLQTPGATLAGNWVGLLPDGVTAGGQTVGIAAQAGGLVGGRRAAARNVVVASAFAGVLVTGADTVVAGNYIGLAPDGLTALPNATGVHADTLATGLRLGTDGDGLGDVFERNVISGNSGSGVVLYGSGHLVAGNYVGLSADGLLARGNGSDGLQLWGSTIQVGGPLPVQRNVVASNASQGLQVGGTSQVVQGNYVGTSATGLSALPNAGGGLLVLAGDGHVIGGAAPGAGNVISGNTDYGLQIGAGAGHVVRGNLVGVGADGVTPLGNTGGANSGTGVILAGSAGPSSVGGPGSADGNVVAHNGGRGIAVTGSAHAALERNQVHSNLGLGIDLGSAGVTPNDAGDGDVGPNNLQNFPVLTYAASDGGSVTVRGSLDSQPGSFRLEFFASPVLDGSGHGEGQIFVGAATVASGAAFDLTFAAAVPRTWFLTATATDAAGDTSEFSQGLTLQPAADLRLTMTDTPDPLPPATTLVYAITAQNLGPSPATDVRVIDALPGVLSLVQTQGCAEDPLGVPQCTLGGIAAGGSKTFTVQVALQPSPPPSATNVAVVTSAEPDPVSGNNSASATTWLVPAGDLAVTVSDGSATVPAGGQTTYTIGVTNAGPSAITGARVQDAFPAGLSCSWTCVGSLGGSCPAAGSEAINAAVDLPAGAAVTFTATCQAAPSVTGSLSNTATAVVPLGSFDPAVANNASTDTDTAVREADLELTQADSPDPAPVFGQVTYTLHVANLGPSDSTGQFLLETLPPGTSLVSTDPPAPTCALVNGGSLGCTLGPLAAGAGTDVVVVVQADPGTLGPVQSLATASGLDTDPIPASNSSNEETTVAFRKGDLDNDLQTDLLFRHLADGHHTVWLMNGVALRSAVDVSPDPDALDWQVVGVDDFDGDHRNDLVLWHAGTGQVEFWLLGGPTGTTRQGAPVPLTGAGPLALDWNLAATADFNADGHPDLVWRNQVSQNIVIWTMGEGGAPGTQKTGAVVPVPAQAVDANWEIVGARDFDGDNATDFLWYNSTSGKIVQWLMDANVQRLTGRFTVPANAGDANWKVLAAGDFGVGAGGVADSNDVVWRNASSGKLVVWYLDLTGIRTAGTFTSPDGPPAPATDWTVAGPR